MSPENYTDQHGRAMNLDAYREPGGPRSLMSILSTARYFGLIKTSEEPSSNRNRNLLLAGTALVGGAAFGVHRLLRAGKVRQQALQGGINTFTSPEPRSVLMTPAGEGAGAYGARTAADQSRVAELGEEIINAKKAVKDAEFAATYRYDNSPTIQLGAPPISREALNADSGVSAAYDALKELRRQYTAIK